MTNLSRRLFLRHTGAAAIVGGSVAAPATVEAAMASDALSRARHHWEMFARAMDDLTAGHGHGWTVSGANRQPFERVLGSGLRLSSRLVRYEIEYPHPSVRLPVERHYEIIGLQIGAESIWLDDACGYADRTVRL